MEAAITVQVLMLKGCVCRVPRRPDLVLRGPSEKTSDGTFILKPEE